MAKIFFSYSHDDESYRDQLEKHLALLRNQGVIETWHDRRLLAGSDFAQSIDAAIDSADVVLLLISASFMASQYCYSVEMSRALERHRRGETQVIPVIVRPCLWQSSPLGVLTAVPRNGKAISQSANFDEAYTDIATQIRAVVEAKAAQLPAVSTPPQAIHGQKSARPPMPRSSNLRLKKEFTELDRDEFLNTTFDFMARFFEGSLLELQERNPGIEGRFRRIDGNTFSAAIYRTGKKLASCAVRLGSGLRDSSITYSNDASGQSNSFNEMLSVKADDQSIYMESMGMAAEGRHLSQEGASELY